MRDNKFAMRSKTILSIAAFTVAFVISAAFASLFISKSEQQSNFVITPSYNTKKTSCFKNRGNRNYVADKIETVIKQDISHGRERGQKLYQIDEDFLAPSASSSFSEYAESVSEYVGSSENLSVEDTPRDFQKAWRKHMKAWRDYSDFLQLSDNKNNIEDFDRADSRYGAEINSTWYEVLRVGRNYGAELY